MQKVIPKKFAGLIIGGILAILMGIIMSFAVTILNIGLTPDFASKWLVAFLGTLPVGLPASLILTALVKNIVDQFTK